MSLAHGFRVAVSDRSSLIASAATDRARASTRRGREFLPTASKSALPSSTVSSFDARRGPARARRAIVTRAERETRLVSVLTSLPRRLELYFARRSYRVTLWRAISVFFGFYLANVMTLSFGALGINDVVAGALSVAFYEIVTRIYYSTLQQNKWLEFVNWFKVGYCYSLIADAFKLGS